MICQPGKTIRDNLKIAEKFLATIKNPCPRSDCEWLFADALKQKRAELYWEYDRELNNDECQLIEAFLIRRKSGEPLQYISGFTEFHHVKIYVGDGVFIPRPETELLVEAAIKRYRHDGMILDLCTGSGAIALALRKAIPPCPAIIGIDISNHALTWANRNKISLNAHGVEFLQGDLFSPLASSVQFSLIVANPPYVTIDEYAGLDHEILNFEPREALLAEENGLAILRQLVEIGQTYLIAGGWLICEIGERQGNAMKALLALKNWTEIEVIRDYNFRDRIVIARKKSN